MRLLKTTILFLIISLSALPSFSQGKKSLKKTYNKGLEFFNNEDFRSALIYFEQLDSIDLDYKLEVKYYIGVCHLKNPQNKEKALPFLEFVIANNQSLVPSHIFRELGIIYLHKHDFDKANSAFKKYQENSLFETTSLAEMTPKEYIEWVKNAQKFVKDSSDVKIEKLSKKANVSEFSPYISADESNLFFMRSSISQQTNWDSIPQIMLASKQNNVWKTANQISLEGLEDKSVKLAGINPDGEQIYLFFDNKLHSCYIDNKANKCTNVKEIVEISGENSLEYISISADGNTIYFSANILNGFGGKDIYSISKKSNGKWSKPVNLGNKVNTKFDEIMPYIHPDNKTLYFSSKGHNTMGGFDIFKTISLGTAKWSKPINLGYPTNSTYDDLNFTLSAKSNTAYFSRQDNPYTNQKSIFKAKSNLSVPLTLVKGVILAGNPLMPIGAKIQVIDKETNSKVKYIYNPNPVNGKFLMIFPPGKNYDMIVNADNYLPQLINIYIPNQSYFYELFQEIHLSPVTTLGKVVGEEISVRNNFYDVNKIDNAGKPDSTSAKENVDLQKMVQKIISITDSLSSNDINNISEYLATNAKKEEKPIKNYGGLLDLINKAIESTDTNTLNKLNKETIYEHKTNQNYFYSANNKFNLIPYVVEKDTLYTAPSINTSLAESTTVVNMNESKISNPIDNLQLKKDSLIIRKVDIEKQKIIISYPITFVENQSMFNKKHNIDILELSELVQNNKRLAIEIESITEAKDTSAKEGILLNGRINSILKALNENGITTSKYVIHKKIGTKQIQEINVKVFEIISDDTLSHIVTKQDIDGQKVGKKITPKTKVVETPKIVEKVPEKVVEKSISNEDLIYKIQIKATKKQLNVNNLIFKGLNATQYFHEDLYKYVVGGFSKMEDAEKYKNEMIKMGFEDAFIVKFDKNGRIK